MKTFFASLLGTVAGLVVFILGSGFLLFLFLMVMAAMGDAQKPQIKDGSYLILDLATNITDAPVQFDNNALVAALSGQDIPAQQQTRLVTRALREAARDDRIQGILIKGSFAPAGFGTSYATLQEVRRALEAFKDAGKPIQAFLQYPDTRDFYIASLASDIALDPQGILLMPGLAAQPTFYAGAFEKFGIGVQVSRVGRFKSAVEPYTRRDLSPENREQLESILNSVWGELRDAVAVSRGLEPAQLQTLVDTGESFLAEDVLEAGLVDRVAYLDEILDELKQATGVTERDESFKQVNLATYIGQMPKVEAAAEEQPVESGDRDGRVAVVYAEGVIVDGEGDPSEVGGAKYAREIRKLRQDPKVKAIVLRVNSPGGSATASEHIQRELRLAAETMPVIVSMGGYAASGGYWISAYGSQVFAEPNTITGSIGVFGMLFNVQGLGSDLGLSWDTVKTGRFADAISVTRPKDAEEMALFQRATDQIYEDFLRKVVEGRKLERAHVEEIAQGRIWSGRQALELGLVDELGGLADAIAFAAQEAGLKAGFRVSEFPRKKEFAEVLAEALNNLAPISARASGWVDRLVQRAQDDVTRLNQFNDPQGLYARLPADLLIE